LLLKFNRFKTIDGVSTTEAERSDSADELVYGLSNPKTLVGLCTMGLINTSLKQMTKKSFKLSPFDMSLLENIHLTKGTQSEKVITKQKIFPYMKGK
jgi:hypothetical protein